MVLLNRDVKLGVLIFSVEGPKSAGKSGGGDFNGSSLDSTTASTSFSPKSDESAASSSCEESYGGWNGDEHLVIKRVRYSSGVETPLITSPTNVPTDPAALYLPKKRLSSSYNIQYSDNNNDQNHVNETEAVKKMLLSQLGSDGAEPVIKLLDKLTGKISSLEKICKSQDQQLRRSEPNHHQTGATDLQRKVNTMEAELHSLKKQLLRRHEAR
ncbi:hypothetical protein Fcan01_15320 [Folsomia candida]|uniref:Uncharacterized protein n=1 Tax=Folsomia candida TaxID=158441 RepID=A0A226DXG5_FOLCA|nr:hypothetical protein Fcan01_15320 [Folsomia candida]